MGRGFLHGSRAREPPDHMERPDQVDEPPEASHEALLYRAHMALPPSPPTTIRPGSAIFSCVIDANPQLEYAAWIWATTLTAYGGQSPSSLAIHFVDDCAPQLRRYFTECGINTASVDRYDVGHPPSNKLAQLTSPLLTGADHYVLCDCDLAFCDDSSPWIDGDRIRAKLVDCAVFSLDDWMRILTASGLVGNHTSGGFPLPTATTLDDKPTIKTYCNGGLLVLPTHAFEVLKEAWPRWHRWLQDRSELLGEHHYHLDQVSFALACIAEELHIDLLPDRLNLPTHLLDHLENLEGVDPVVLHFHHRATTRGLLHPTGVASVDAGIAQVNALIGQRLEQVNDDLF